MAIPLAIGVPQNHVTSFGLCPRPEELDSQRCRCIVKCARKRLRGEDKNSLHPHDNSLSFDTKAQIEVIGHSQIELGKLLGEGNFSSVFAIRSLKPKNYDSDEDEENETCDSLVVKFLRPKLYEDHGLYAAAASDLVKEGNILATLSHKNIIRLHALSSNNGVCSYLNGDHDSYYLVLERLHMTLSERLERWKTRHTYLYGDAERDGSYDPASALVRVLEAGSPEAIAAAKAAAASQHGDEPSSMTFRLRKSLRASFKKTSIKFGVGANGGKGHLETSVRTTVTNSMSELGLGSEFDYDSDEEYQYDPTKDKGNTEKSSFTENSNSDSENSNSDREIAAAKTKLLSERLDVTLQLADAISYLHGEQIVHRDLKPDNIGFDANGDLKVFDFDIARVCPSASNMNSSFTSLFSSKRSEENETFHMTQNCGNPRYMAPECARCEPYNQKSDVYSMALLAHQVLTLQMPYEDITEDTHHRMVTKKGVRPHLPQGLPSNAKKLLKRSWSGESSDRPSSEAFRKLFAKNCSEILRSGTMNKSRGSAISPPNSPCSTKSGSSSSTPTSTLTMERTGYVWSSLSFGAISDNSTKLQIITVASKKKLKTKAKSTKTLMPNKNDRKTRGSFHNFYSRSSQSPGSPGSFKNFYSRSSRSPGSPGSFDGLRGSFQQRRGSVDNIRETLQQKGHSSFRSLRGSLTPNPRKKRLSVQKNKLAAMFHKNLDKSRKNSIVLPLVNE